MAIISQKEHLEILDLLEQRKLFFRTLWSITDIQVTDDVSTACVRLVDDRISFMFNTDLWQQSSLQFKLFVICHEQLHIMLDHFNRLHFEQGDHQNKNKAADLPINHMLIRNYGFDRERDIPNWRDYCWVETIFPENVNMPDNETVEFYYAQIKLQQETSKNNGRPSSSGGVGDKQQTFDDHQQTDSSLNGNDVPQHIKQKIKQAFDDYVEERTEGMSQQEKEQWLEEFSPGQGYGGGFGNEQQSHNLKKKKVKSWKTLYNRIPKRLLATKVQNHWLTIPRRFSLMGDELLIPNEMEIDKKDRVKMNVYLDTSGSCANDAKYFLQSAISFDEKLFDVQIFGFSDGVYEISKKPPYLLRGFGGTSFQKISEHVDAYKTNVDAVFVFTDGDDPSATNIRYPKRWHWFILPNGTKKHINPLCNVYDLKDFSWKA
jgi:predicted metal-dependent peptidase